MTLRVRLTTYYIAVFVLALLVLGVGLYFGVRQIIFQRVLDELRVGSALVQQSYQRTGTLRDPALIGVVQARTPIVYVEIIDLRGTVVLRSQQFPSDLLPVTDEQIRAVLSGEEVPIIHDLGATRVLSLVTPLQVGPRIVGAIQVAQSLQQMDQSLRALAWALAGGGMVALLVGAWGGLWLTRAALQPIDQVSATAERIISADDLQQRVPQAMTEDELGRLTRTINQMLERMERMFRTQQRFTADVAHELRTPLAAMRGNLEVLRRGAQHNPEMLAESLRDIESEVLRLSRMTNDLLILAQADAGVALRLGRIALDEVVLEVYRELRPLADHVQFQVDLQAQVLIDGDRDRLKQALINLLANALQHTPAGGSVTLRLCQSDGWASVEVADTGSGIAAEHVPHLFDRFYRGDRARSHSGAGLGLSIVKWVAEAHGGQVKVATEVGKGSTFAIELPLRRPEQDTATDGAPTGEQGRADGVPHVRSASGAEQT